MIYIDDGNIKQQVVGYKCFNKSTKYCRSFKKEEKIVFGGDGV